MKKYVIKEITEYGYVSCIVFGSVGFNKDIIKLIAKYRIWRSEWGHTQQSGVYPPYWKKLFVNKEKPNENL